MTKEVKPIPEKMAKEIVKASMGHVKENATFTTKPPLETENVTTVDDLSDEVRQLPKKEEDE